MTAKNYVYWVGNNLYINLTNKCTNRCSFCLRNNGDGVYGSDTLWLSAEPTAAEVLSEIEKLDVSQTGEFVFCGYGEPTMKLDVLLDISRGLKKLYNKPVRLNTNGHANAFAGRDITEWLRGLIDTVSISMNCSNEADYNKICLPQIDNAYGEMLDFGKKCVGIVPNVIFSVVDKTISDEEIEICRRQAEARGAKLRVRAFE